MQQFLEVNFSKVLHLLFNSNMDNSNIEESGEAVNEKLDQIISNKEIVLCYI